MTCYCPKRRSEISCCRNGILSMDRDNSRTLHGDGLRRATRPSFPTRAIMYPRGRKAVRNSVCAVTSVSVMMITSRSAKSSSPPINRSNCCWKRGSFGVSAKTTKGRTTHCSSDRLISAPSKICVWSCSHRSRTVVSCAKSDDAAKTAARVMFVNNFINLDIEATLPKAKGLMQMNANIFASTPAMDRRRR